MKRIFYFILLLAGFSSIHSCKDLLDEDGNPLLDLNNNSGLTGPRALYREITDSDTLAEYHYNGLLLYRVLTDSASVTDVMYSGNKVSKITFNGFLDLDGDGKLDKDSVSYTQLFNYGNTGRLETISENRSLYNPPSTPGPQVLFKKIKSRHSLIYSASTSKMDSVITETGEEIPGTTFVYSEYSKAGYSYVGDNVSKVVRHYGVLNGGPPTERYSYEYSNYDTQISPYTLLPFAYRLSAILATKSSDSKSLMLSPNSPKRMAITDLTLPIPAPVIFSTDYSYDPQTYVVRGFGINYIYKPL